jgi:hypothetical protein
VHYQLIVNEIEAVRLRFKRVRDHVSDCDQNNKRSKGGGEISQRKTNKVWDGVGLTQVFRERG